MHLAPIDWIIIAVYLVGCMAAGIYMRRYVHGVEDFAVDNAGRVYAQTAPKTNTFIYVDKRIVGHIKVWENLKPERDHQSLRLFF